MTKFDTDAARAEAARANDILNGTASPSQKAEFNLETDPIYGALSGFLLPTDEYVMAPGVTLRRTFANLFAPFMVAFAEPDQPSKPSPGPWAAAGIHGQKMYVEVEMDADRRIGRFDRLNSIWFLAALLRLRLDLPILVPLLSDRSLQAIPADTGGAHLHPMEVDLMRMGIKPKAVSLADLDWVRHHLDQAAALMQDPVFNRALQTLDRALGIVVPGAGLVIAWASIETLLQIGSHDITRRLCRALAAYLYPAGPHRDRGFTLISACYKERGQAAHGGKTPEEKAFRRSFGLARTALIETIAQGCLPDTSKLLDRWLAERKN